MTSPFSPSLLKTFRASELRAPGFICMLYSLFTSVDRWQLFRAIFSFLHVLVSEITSRLKSFRPLLYYRVIPLSFPPQRLLGGHPSLFGIDSRRTFLSSLPLRRITDSSIAVAHPSFPLNYARAEYLSFPLLLIELSFHSAAGVFTLGPDYSPFFPRCTVFFFFSLDLVWPDLGNVGF